MKIQNMPAQHENTLMGKADPLASVALWPYAPLYPSAKDDIHPHGNSHGYYRLIYKV